MSLISRKFSPETFLSVVGGHDRPFPIEGSDPSRLIAHLTGNGDISDPDNVGRAREALLQQHPDLQTARNNFLQFHPTDPAHKDRWATEWVGNIRNMHRMELVEVAPIVHMRVGRFLRGQAGNIFRKAWRKASARMNPFRPDPPSDRPTRRKTPRAG